MGPFILRESKREDDSMKEIVHEGNLIEDPVVIHMDLKATRLNA